MYIPADLPVCQPTCSFDVFLPINHEHPPMPPSTGLYTRYIFCSAYTQAYAFLPAKINDLPVDSTTRLHTHRHLFISLPVCLFFLRINLCTYLWTHMLVHVPKRPTYPKCTYLLILILSFRQTRKTYRSTQPRVHIPIDATVFHPTCSFWGLHSDKPLIPTCPLTCYTTYPPPPLPHTSSSVYMFILTFLVSVKVQACPSTHLLVRVPRDVPENEPTLMAPFRLITKTYVSNQLVVYLSMDAPFPQNHLFISMLSYRLTTNTYFSIQLFVYMPTDEPVHQPTCAFAYFHSD